MRNYAAKRAFLGIGRLPALIRGFFTLMAVAVGVAALTPGAYAQGTVKSKHQDWEVRCDKVTGSATEQCVVMQYILAEDRPGVGLTVILLKTADKGARLLRVLAPLGVFLPSGLGLKIDEADVGRSGFVRCVQQGCLAEVILDDKLLNQLKTGKSALFVVFQTPEEGIGIPVSLAGLSQGFDALP